MSKAPTIWTIWSALTRALPIGGRDRADPITRRSPRRFATAGSPTGDVVAAETVENSRTHQIEHQVGGAVAIESPVAPARRPPDQDRTRHLEQEVDHSDRPLDTVVRICSMTALFMIGTSRGGFGDFRAHRAREGIVRQGQADADGRAAVATRSSPLA